MALCQGAQVTYGSITTDEMLLVYFIWADHEEGDEDFVFGTVEEEEPAGVIAPLLSDGRLKVHPNPVREGSEVTWSGQGKAQAVLRALGGGVVWTGTLEPGIQVAPWSHLPAGTYLLSAHEGKEGRATLAFQGCIECL